MTRNQLIIPNIFLEKLEQADIGAITSVSNKYSALLRDNKLYFFPEYTDHGIEHVEEVLKAASEIINNESIDLLNSKDITILILAILLHDLGMHIPQKHV